MRIKKHSIQNLVETISLSEHLKRYIELKSSGGNWLGICPFHQDSTPSFYVYPNNYHCFACNAHGSIIDYEIHRTGLSFKESIEQLAQLYKYPLEYESSEFDEKNKQRLQTQNEQISVLKKMSVGQITNQDLKIINSFYYNPPELKEKISNLNQFESISPLLKENGDIYGYVFLNSNLTSPQFLTINKNLMPCLNWNEARPYSIKEKQLIVTFDILDLKLFHEKNIYNVVSCIKEIDINLLKLFAKRVKKITLIIPEHREGKLFLWQTFQNCINYNDISVDVLMTHEDREKRNLFFLGMSEEKIRVWLQNSEKIHIKVTQLFLDSLTKEKNKLLCFKEKILPIINQIKEFSIKKSLLIDISNRYFYSIDIALPVPFIAPAPFPNKPTISLLSRSELSSESADIETPIIPIAHLGKATLDAKHKEFNFHHELIELTSRTIEFYHKCLLQNKNSNKNEPLIYLKSRGLSDADIKRWKIGYCSSNHNLSQKAQTGIISQKNLSILSIIKKYKSGENFYDFFHDRIIIPILNHKGDFVALSGRTFLSTDIMPKYINSSESEIFSKSKILFNFYQALNSIIINKYVIIVEGYMDCISLVNAGFENVVAVMGTALTKFHLEELSKLTKRIVLCFDNDKAGQSAAKRTFAAAVSFQNVDLEYLMLPDCKDPDEYIKRFGKDNFLNIAKNKNTLLYEKICEWCHVDSHDYQEFTVNIQKEFSCLIEANNETLTKQVGNYILDKFNINLRNFFSKNHLSKSSIESKTLIYSPASTEQELEFDWSIKNPIEMKLLLSLLSLKFSELPERLQNIMLGSLSVNKSDEKICAQAIENQFSKTGFRVFLEISSWMFENPHVAVNYAGIDVFELFSPESQILIGFSLSDIKILMRFNLHELIKDSLSSGISMVLSTNVWNLKNAGFLKFLHRNINLAFQNGVLSSLFAEALLNLEVDYIDSTLKAHSSLHFDNDLDAQFQFLVAERVRCKTKLGKIGSI